MKEVREREEKILRRSDENRPDEVTGESRLFQDSALSCWCSYSVTIVLLLLYIVLPNMQGMLVINQSQSRNPVVLP